MMKPWKLSLLLLAGSLALMVLFWMLGMPFFFLFLFVPLLPLLSGRSRIRRCPVCGWQTSGRERFCPYDATLLKESQHDENAGDD